MSLLNPADKILVQGITGREAMGMVEDSLAYGSPIASGVTPGKGGQQVHGVPVFNTVEKAVAATGATIKLCLIMTERVPRLDTVRLLAMARQANCTVIGPNTLGLIRPGVAKLGTIGGRVDNVKRSFSRGKVAILSRSGGMTTEIASFLTSRGIGQSLAIGVGGDVIVGSNFTDLFPLLENDPETEAVVIYGEPGGGAEEQLADFIKGRGTRLRINAFLSGRFVDEMQGVRFGHAAVLVEGDRGSVKGKVKALRAAGVFVADKFDDILEGLPQ
jgi:succinyl-CoA synthetase alpha subunit